jgi:hypothetical protein
MKYAYLKYGLDSYMETKEFTDVKAKPLSVDEALSRFNFSPLRQIKDDPEILKEAGVSVSGGATTDQIGRASAYRTYVDKVKVKNKKTGNEYYTRPPEFKLLSDIVHSGDKRKNAEFGKSIYRDLTFKHDEDVEKVLDAMEKTFFIHLYYNIEYGGFYRPAGLAKLAKSKNVEDYYFDRKADENKPIFNNPDVALYIIEALEEDGIKFYINSNNVNIRAYDSYKKELLDYILNEAEKAGYSKREITSTPPDKIPIDEKWGFDDDNVFDALFKKGLVDEYGDVIYDEDIEKV